MNAAENIVDAYFRLCRKCFTLSDLKVESGNNRQFDLLAHDLANGESFHIEVGVTHRPNWCPTITQLEERFEKKFFGAFPKRGDSSSKRTDEALNKNYFAQIEQTYKRVGIDPRKIRRVWVCWQVKELETPVPQLHKIHSPSLKKDFQVEILSLRHHVLPALQAEIGTSNYDDEVLRTIGFLKQSTDQMAEEARAAAKSKARLEKQLAKQKA